MARATKKTAGKKTAKKKMPGKRGSSRKKRTAKAQRSSAIPVKTAPAKPTATEETLAPLADVEKMFDDFLQRHWLRPFSWPRSGELSGLLEQGAPSVDVVDRAKEVWFGRRFRVSTKRISMSRLQIGP